MDTRDCFFLSEDSYQIDRSRWFLVDIVRELGGKRQKAVTGKEVRKSLVNKLRNNNTLAKKFYLGYGTSIEEILYGMQIFGFLRHSYSNNADGSKYRLTEAGEKVLSKRASEFYYLLE